MREIKFRVWDIEEKKMINVYGLEFKDTGIVVTSDEGYDYIVEEDCELMQFTGLKDKNGKEIYEGDIIEGRYGRQTVEWHLATGFDSGLGELWGTNKEWLEVIGNIYENPELLIHKSKQK